MPRGGRGSRAAAGQGKRGGRRAVQGNNGAERVTRSSKAKLTNGLEDPAQVEKELNAQLRSMGLYAANITGDGNCLFRALSDQLYGYPHQHADLRQRVCDYLASRPDRFAGFVDVEKSFDDYVRGMRQSGTYGGHLELSAFARLIQKEIKIVQPGLVYVISGDDESPQAIKERERREEERRIAQTQSFPGSEGPPLSERTLRKMRRAGITRADTSDTQEQSTSEVRIASPSTSGSTESVDEVDRQTALATPSGNSQPSTSKIEAYGPLWIAYHNWEHYSSIRNVDGPHCGLPRINEKRATLNAHGRQGESTYGGATTQAVKDEADEDNPVASQEEELLLKSTVGYTLQQARFYIKRHGNWEAALEAILANEVAQEEEVAVEGEEETDDKGNRKSIDVRARTLPGTSGAVHNHVRLDDSRTPSASPIPDHLTDWRATSPSSVDTSGTRSSVERASNSTHATTDDSPEATLHGPSLKSELRRSKRTASKDPTSNIRSPKRRSRSRSPMQSQHGSGQGSGTDLAGLVAANAIANISVASGEHTPIEAHSVRVTSPLRPYSEERSDGEDALVRTNSKSKSGAEASHVAVEDPDKTPRARMAVTPRPVSRTLTMRERREMRKADKVRRALDTKMKREGRNDGDKTYPSTVVANDRNSADVKGFLELKV